MNRICRLAVAIAATTTLTAAAPTVMAHGDGGHAKAPKTSISSEQHPFGVEGDPKRASRTVAITMDDTMHYSQSDIRVAQGETVTFVISNKGKLMHELVLGTEEELKEHAEQMRKNPEMEHDEPYMAHVKPGATEKMTWKFTKAGTFAYSCTYHPRMKGTIAVADK